MAEAARLAEVARATVAKAIESYAAVAKDRADLGAIAVLAEYADRPLRSKARELRAALER